MEDIFGDIQDLDISKLISPDKENKQPTAASSNGRFTIGPDIEELESEKEKSTIGIEDKKPIIQEEETEEVEQSEPETKVEAGSVIKEIASFLKEKGVVEFTDEEFQDQDDFIPEIVNKAITKGKEAGINDYKESLPEEIKNLINNYEDGVPLGQLLEVEQRVFEVSSIEPERIKESSRLQEEIISAYMSNTGWNQTEIDERVKELQDANLMEKEALRSHTKLVQIEKENKQQLIKEAQQKKIENQTKQREQIDNLKKSINDKKEFFTGIPTNDIEKRDVFNAITKVDKNGRNEITQMLSDPETYIKVAYFLKVMKQDTSKLKTVIKTEVVNGVKKTLGEQPVKTESRFGKADLSTIKNFLKRTN